MIDEIKPRFITMGILSLPYSLATCNADSSSQNMYDIDMMWQNYEVIYSEHKIKSYEN